MESDIFFISDTHFGHGNCIKNAARLSFVSDSELNIILNGKYFFVNGIFFGEKNPTEKQKQAFHDLKISDETIKRHDDALIENWNKTVGKTDRVYFLGDFSFHARKQTEKILNTLNGRIFFIKGNHDHGMERFKTRFQIYKDLYTLKVPQDMTDAVQKIVLCHYSLMTWNCMHHGAWHLYGHSHGGLENLKEQILPNLPSMDVGVDSTYNDTSFLRNVGREEWFGFDYPDAYRPLSLVKDIVPRLKVKKFTPIDHHTEKNID